MTETHDDFQDGGLVPVAPDPLHRDRDETPPPDPAMIVSALAALPNDTGPQAVEGELRKLIPACAGLDEIALVRLREELIQAIGKKVTSPARFVDAALRPMQTSNPADASALSLRADVPAKEPVDGASLLDDLAALFAHHIVLESVQAIALALWVVHTVAIDVAHYTPRLAIVSPEKRCGKTRLLRVICALVQRPLPTATISPAAIFRSIEAFHPTLLVDEADAFLRDNEELRGVLNAGHSRGTPAVRCVGDDHTATLFDTFAAAAIACIGRLPGTLMDRAVVISMRRRRPDEAFASLPRRLDEAFRERRRRIVRWVADHKTDLEAAEPDMPEVLDDRARDNWSPLLAVADAAGGRWSVVARNAAITLSTTERDVDQDSVRVTLLSDLRVYFEGLTSDFAKSTDVTGWLATLEERPWRDWKRGQPITPQQVASLLRPFGINSKQQRTANRNARCYLRADLVDAFRRYLPPLTTAATADNDNDLRTPAAATTPHSGGAPAGHKANSTNDVAPVAGPRGEAGPRITAPSPTSELDTPLPARDKENHDHDPPGF